MGSVSFLFEAQHIVFHYWRGMG